MQQTQSLNSGYEDVKTQTKNCKLNETVGGLSSFGSYTNQLTQSSRDWDRTWGKIRHNFPFVDEGR